jgi:hypothetical protein
MYMLKKIFALVTAVLLVAFFYSPKPAKAACEALPSDRGLASYTINIAEAAQYDIWLLMYAPGGDKNSVAVQIDNECPWIAGDKDGAQEFSWLNSTAIPATRIRLTLDSSMFFLYKEMKRAIL